MLCGVPICAMAPFCNAIAKFQGLRLVVCHVDRRDAKRPQGAIKFAAQPVTQCGVKRQRLVEQQYSRTDSDRARQRHALPLTIRKPINAPAFETFDVGQRDELSDAGRALLLRDTADPQTVADIVRNCHIGKERIGLKHHAPLTDLPTALKYARERIEDAVKVVATNRSAGAVTGAAE
jgi:hypothetical protein